MLVRKSRSVKSFNSRVEFLEKRMLLAAFIDNPLTFNSDFVGSTASVGPDGYTDIGLTIKGLTDRSINSIRITANTAAGDLNWAYGDLKNGLPYAEFIRSDFNSSCGTFPYRADYNKIDEGTIYISPLTNSHYNNITVQLNLHNDLNNTNYSENLTLSPNYSWSPTTVFTGRSVTNLPVYGGSATFAPNQVAPASANTTAHSGDIHISATLPAGYVYSNILNVSMSDGINSPSNYGDANDLLNGSVIWSDNSTFEGLNLNRTAVSSSSTSFDLYAQPLRNEAGACMTLTMVLNNGTGPKTYLTQFTGQTVDVNKYNKLSATN